MTLTQSLADKASSMVWLHLGDWLRAKDLEAIAERCHRNAASGEGRAALEAVFRVSRRLLETGRNREALRFCAKSLRRNAKEPRIWCAYGAALRYLARMEPARKAYEKAIALDPSYAQAWCNLGEWCLARGNARAALEHFNHALELDKELLEAQNNRIAALYELGRFTDAQSAAETAIRSHPLEAALYVNLGTVLLHSGKARPAVTAFRKALECDPACAEAHLNLATLFGETHHLSRALAHVRHEIAIKGKSAQRLASLALAEKANGDIKEAEAVCKQVLEMQPGNVSALITLAGCLSMRADHLGAILLHQQALDSNPQMPAICSNIAFDATYLPDISESELFEFHAQWSRRFEVPVADRIYSHQLSKVTSRPLRIGYVSGDFGRHPVGFLLRDVLQHHDRNSYYIHCYSMMRQSDEITHAIRRNADSWIDALLLSDENLAEHIHQDRIDILVDLSGHTAYNRLPTFARKPAPIQATWIGYFHSTGMDTMDYFITDPHTSPRGCGQLFSETPVWLPDSRFCYSPPHYAPEVSPPPGIAAGRITFGSFNRTEKLVPPVIATWARILHGVDESRLLLKSGGLDNEDLRKDLIRRFGDHGIAAHRLDLRGASPHPEMLEQYSEVDIALDPFPFNGGMTTLEAIWMGVPVITINGHSVVSRQTVSVLENIGAADELVFPDVESYINGAIALAGDVERVARLRRSLRELMAGSPVRDAQRFCSDLENLYRRMWHAWCRGEKLPGDI